jgi:aspartyl-tRNA(Asn)/glutamyl-tRNA(Gln) amidotransferase subunit B
VSSWEAVIGLETHVELQTASKMFCGCPVAFGGDPNTVCCPVCLGLPGALPVANEEAIERILRIGAAMNCTLTETSLFYRKNYYYPDLPKNYQITQYTYPLCEDGYLDLDIDGDTARIGITRVHMEEDTGKSLHVGGGGRIQDAGQTLLDFNRSGVPLVEVVSEPDIRSPEQARAYGVELQRIVRSLGVSDAKLEEGSMRFDVNVSMRPAGSDEFGTRSEVKNVNSLRSLQRVIAYEIERQVDVLEAGGTVIQETRHWDEATGVTTAMRSKEESEDYRYFQEPDLLPLHIGRDWQERVRAALPELPAKRRARFRELGVGPQTATLLVDDSDLAELFEAAVADGASARTAGLWLTGPVVAHLRKAEVEVTDTALGAGDLVELSDMVDGGELSATAAKDVLSAVMDGAGRPRQIAEDRDLMQVSDEGAIAEEVDAVIAANPDAIAKLRDGDMKPLGFLVGQVMRATGGKADPKLVQEVLRGKAAE